VGFTPYRGLKKIVAPLSGVNNRQKVIVTLYIFVYQRFTRFVNNKLQKNVKYLNYNRIKQRIDFKIYKDEKIYKAFNNDSYIPLLYTIRKAKAIPMYWEVNEKTKKTVLVMGITELAASETHILIDTIIRHMASQDIEVDVCLTSDKLFSDFELKYKELTLEELEEFSKKIDDIKAEEFLKYLLIYSILHGVSDIHISPSSNDFARIAVRVFGDIETLFYIPSSEYNKLVSVIKTNADMKAEKTKYSSC
jgi:type II secretory ATPase GspE/PulE/Tfp pilus assembly ATPase PilB-like protein